MSIVRYIADPHIGHENMARKRGFANAEEHDEHFIKCWNSVVHKKDTTYVLGDVTMEKRTNYHILNRLNGFKVFVGGNHDMPQHTQSLLEYGKVAGMIKKKFKKHRITAFLTHCPIHPMELEHRVGLNIHGHIHEHTVMRRKLLFFKEPDPRYICVSCEHVDYTPKTIEELLGPSKFDV